MFPREGDPKGWSTVLLTARWAAGGNLFPAAMCTECSLNVHPMFPECELNVP
jgi:hypothetical protein